ncbi:MAG: HAD family hydrolase [Bacteroidota bacterium]
MSPQCIIFDCDGVLVDSEALSNRVLIDMAQEQGVTISEDYADAHFQGQFLHHIFDWIAKQSGRPLPKDFEQDYRARTFGLFRTDLQPVDGIREVLEHINLPKCVASSGPLNKIKLNLTVTGLIDYFDGHLFSCYDIGKWKPDPAIFLYAAEKMGFAPSDCLVVEDSLPGVRAARAGGFRVLGYANTRNRKAFEAEGAQVIGDVREVLKIFSLKNATS